MKNKVLVSAFCILLLVQFFFFGYRYYQNTPKDFSKVQTDAYESDFKYYYNHLTENGKKAYILILDVISEFPEKIEIPNLTAQEYDDMFLALSYDNPTLLSLGNTSQLRTEGRHYFFIPDYRLTEEEDQKQQIQLEEKIAEIKKGMHKNMSDYDKELYFHDYLCENTVYDARPPVGYSAYDAIVSGNAVCEGYARAMQLLLTSENIPNYLITGKSKDFVDENSNTSQGHMWNIVIIDGKSYHLDVTWDDVGEKRNDQFQHNYFNVTQKEILRNHSDLFPLENDCIYSEHNYFEQNKCSFSAYNEYAKHRIMELMQGAIRNQSHVFEIRFTNYGSYHEANQKLIQNSDIFKLLKEADYAFFKQCKDISYINVDELGTIQFIMKKEK